MEEKNDRPEKSALAQREEEILARWQEKKIFEQSLTKPASAKSFGEAKEFVFYDGPPFATGTPHYGHLIGGTIKDVIPRYKTMQGFHVSRRWGWDCHGLPVENLIEKELGLKSKKDIEDYGIGNFNAKARASVMRYADEWKKTVPRLGRFVDMDNDYRTMDPTYTETIWWIFKNLSDQGLIYEGYKAMQICPRCETTLSNFEVNQGYKDITDISVFVKFKVQNSKLKTAIQNSKVKDEDNTYIVAWTTTPWTLPGNVALAVGKDIDYVKIKIKNEESEDYYIIAKSRLEAVMASRGNLVTVYNIEQTFKGSDLIGLSYEPVFDYYSNPNEAEIRRRSALSPRESVSWENGWKIYGADFITTEDGTGVVHIAPAFGEDDMKLGQKENLPFIQPVGLNGVFKPEVGDGLAGQPVKPKDNPQATDIEIIKILAAKGFLLAKEKIIHSYPHCWRCETPLLNYATSSWFLEVTKIRDRLVAENKKINWVPEHIQEGRFGKWLEGARDWAISRTRFWGAPLPVWRCEICGEKKVIGSLVDLQEATGPAQNNYWLMRHGQAESNIVNVTSFGKEATDPLTAEGVAQVKESAKIFSTKDKIDLIISSPFRRARETAELTAGELGLPVDEIIFDDRLREAGPGIFDGQNWPGYYLVSEQTESGLETLSQIRIRVSSLLFELENKYKNKRILLVSHGLPLRITTFAGLGIDTRELLKNLEKPDFKFKNAEIKPLAFKPYPHNSDFDLDYHRPYIDEVTWPCACGGQMKRIPEVFDCWFESGAMPYAQSHYPFGDSQKTFDPTKQISFPADFIAEGQDQTRGWFYTMLVLGTALFGQSPYKNVVVNGLIQAEDGRKMSKSLNNYPDPLVLANKYSADALRLYLLASPAVHAEDLNFSEKGVGEIQRKILSRLLNVVTFLETYGEIKGGDIKLEKTEDVLDRWILSRLGETLAKVEKEFDGYELDRAVTALDSFIDDLSNWYLRRSRDRFRGEDKKVREQANQTLLFVLLTTAKIIAPLAPFVADDIYLRLTKEQAKDSVHLEAWPEALAIDEELLTQMKEVRKVVALGLEMRMSAGVKVRQPLQSLKIADAKLSGQTELLELIKDELNVKEVLFDKASGEPVWLDIEITPALREEGIARDFIRLIQEKRKQENLVPSDQVDLKIFVWPRSREVLEKFSDEIKRVAGLNNIEFLSAEPTSEPVGSVQEEPVWLDLVR